MMSRVAAWVMLAGLHALAGARLAQAQDVADHVPPPPPAQPMAAMSDAEMTRVMEMDDAAVLAMFKLDELERGIGDAPATTWNAQGWIGGDIDKLWLRGEGQREAGRDDARIEALWDHAFATWWDWQLGVRADAGSGAPRQWLAAGVQGTAPYWFNVEATAYVGASGRTAARLRIEYELLLTQRLILQPEIELNAYGRADRARAVASGLADAELGLRLRYEVTRKIAPYVGVVRDLVRDGDGAAPFAGQASPASHTRLVAGVRLWF